MRGGCHKHHLRNLQDLIEDNMIQKDNPWSWFTSWLPDITWLKQIFAVGILLILIGIIACCIQCSPLIVTGIKKLSKCHRDNEPMVQMIRVEYMIPIDIKYKPVDRVDPLLIEEIELIDVCMV